MGEVTRYDPTIQYVGDGQFVEGMKVSSDGDYVPYAVYAADVATAKSAGARQERGRIRGLELDENVRGLLKGVMHAIHHTPWSTSAWRALLAAITEEP